MASLETPGIKELLLAETRKKLASAVPFDRPAEVERARALQFLKDVESRLTSQGKGQANTFPNLLGINDPLTSLP
jgi:hypothetical protein